MGERKLMRKNIIYIFIITLIMLISFVNLGYANSGPTFWHGYPSLEILSIEENSPIVVENEDLIFDFSKDEYLEYGDYSISGLVTAIYRMSNQSSEDQTVQMAFPIISSLRRFNPEEIDIKIDNKSIPFDIYIGDEVGNIRNRKDDQEDDRLDFEQILKSINREVYLPQNYDLNEIGTLYTYNVSRTSEEDVNFVIEYTYDREKTRLITKGFNGYWEDNGEIRISSWIHDKEILEIYVIGEDIDFNIRVFTDGELSKVTDAYSYELKKDDISLEDYLKKSIVEYKDFDRYNDYLADNQLLNLVYKGLDDIIEHNVVNLWIDELFSLDDLDRIILLIYEVNFSKESGREVSVSYLSRGTMDRTSTYDPLYTFDYLLNPAERWAGFTNLNIEIRPPKSNPYIVDSSIDLFKNEDGNYIGNFESLPDKDLSFTLYSKEEITFMDKVKRKVDNLAYALPFIIAIGVPFLISLIKKVIRARNYKE